jgi:cytochrome c peroxidase
MKTAWSCVLASLVFAAGCGGSEIDADDSAVETEVEADGTSSEALQLLTGQSLFEQGTFGGNGRTCLTCHGDATGTFSLAEAKARYVADPCEPLFRPIDSDTGNGASYHRLLDYGTVIVTVPLAPGVKLASSPSAKSVRLERSIPSTLNTPALDPVLMWDGRAPSLEAQASGAIETHAQGTAPSAANLAKIADFEETLFSSTILKKYAAGGPAPTLPLGVTASQKRGRLFFLDTPFVPPSLHGFCASCHSGPLINTTNQYNPLQPPGLRFSTALVSELNERNIPPRTYLFPTPGGGTTTVISPDPGRALITGKLADVNTFKIPSLWNIKNTAPYFHDGSAKTLEDVVNQYQKFTIFFTGLSFTPQELDDMVAYMKIL